MKNTIPDAGWKEERRVGMKSHEHTNRHALLVGVGLLAAALGLNRVMPHDDVDPSGTGRLPAVANGTTSAISAEGNIASEQSGALTEDPAWRALSSSQRHALAPLEQVWPTLSDSARQRWLAIAARLPSDTEATRNRLHARMAQWSKLSSTQRAEARWQYLQTAKLDAQHKRERWEAYNRSQRERRLAPATKQPIEVISPVWVRARPGATTMLMTQLVDRPPPPSERSKLIETGLPAPIQAAPTL